MSKESMENVLPLIEAVELANGEIVEVKKLPLGEYARLLLLLKNLPSGVVQEFQKLDTKDDEQFVQVMFGVFAEAWEQVIEIISIGSGIDKDRLKTDNVIGLDGGVDLFMAIYKVNNLQRVVKTAKNAMAGKVQK